MKDIGVVKIHCISELLSPLTHMSGTSGNEALINRENIVDENGVIKSIPVISGNSIRHRMVREPASQYLVNQLELKGKLSIDQANFMFFGGTLKESSLVDNMKVIAELYELFPLYRLLGGSLKNQIVSGSLISLRGMLMCEENRSTINNLLPEGYMIDLKLKSSDHYINDYQYTRGDIRNHKDCDKILEEKKEEEHDKKKKEKTNLMIYNGQTVVTGSIFYHGFILNSVSRKEVGALVHALNQWQETTGNLGGQGRIGHGKIKLNIIIEDSQDFITAQDIPDCIAEYIKHVGENKEKCSEFLNKVFK